MAGGFLVEKKAVAHAMTLPPLAAFPALSPHTAAGAASASRNAQQHTAPSALSPPDSTLPSTEDDPARDGEQPRDALEADRAERAASPDGLTAKERGLVAELQRVDRQVRAHEQAHLAAAGGLARGVSFRCATGPDGRRYAVGGEVRIDTAPVKGDPQATVRKAQQIRAAANAPANPSAQDRAVAAQASAMEAQARQELFAARRLAFEQRLRSSQAQSFIDNRVELGTIFDAVG